MDLASSFELLRLMFIFGIVTSLLFRRLFGFNAGGIVVPSFLAVMYTHSIPLSIILFLLSFVVYYLYEFTFAKRALTGRYPVLIKIFYSILAVGLLYYFTSFVDKSGTTVIIGFVVPGLLASSYRKHSIFPVALGTIIVTIFTLVFGILLYRFLPSYLTTYTASRAADLNLPVYELSSKFIQFFVSATAALLLHIKFKVRAGGLVVSPVIASLVLSPINFAIFVALTALTYGIVRLVQEKSHLIGLNRFVFATVLSIIFVWIAENVMLGLKVNFSPLLLTSLYVPIALGVWVNDLSIQGIKKSAFGFSVATFCSLATMLLINLI